MAGSKNNFDGIYLTSPSVYRSGLTERDTSPDAPMPEIRLDVDETKLHYDETGSPAGYEVSGRAYNGHLQLYVHYTAPEDAGDPGQCEVTHNGLVDGVLN